MNNNTPLDIERINERDREDEQPLTVSALYDAQGEVKSDKAMTKWFEDLVEYVNKQEA